jgi:hypothetical protein
MTFNVGPYAWSDKAPTSARSANASLGTLAVNPSAEDGADRRIDSDGTLPESAMLDGAGAGMARDSPGVVPVRAKDAEGATSRMERAGALEAKDSADDGATKAMESAGALPESARLDGVGQISPEDPETWSVGA